MKKLVVGCIVAAVVFMCVPAVAPAANSDPGGVKGFLAGGCTKWKSEGQRFLFFYLR
jgi:hypothetical protein